MGWALGANDGANVFGTAVASRMIKYRTAVTLAGAFILLGAVLQGAGAVHTIGGLTHQTAQSAMIVALTAGLTVLAMTALKLPVSSNQAMVGAILGMGLRLNPESVRWSILAEVVVCWIGTPIGAALVAAVLYPTLEWVFGRFQMNLVTKSIVLKTALMISGCYGAYALGANSAGNVTSAFYGPLMESGYKNVELICTLVGGASIALGVITYSRNVMFTVGSRLVQLGAFSALIAVLAEAITIHFYSFLGVPVSTSQAIVGAVLGIGIAKSLRTINRGMLYSIFLGWMATPVIAGVICFLIAWVGLRSG